MSKYSPLAEYLAGLDSTTKRLTFAEIEEIIADTLPPSALKHAAWWSNSDRGKNGWSNLWKRAGWVRADFDQTEKWVVFQRPEHFGAESVGAREGHDLDRTILAPLRNAAVADRRKKNDDYRCQACGFRMQVRGQFVIEVHHLEPFSLKGERVTTLDKLVSLCPTCHRIAHLRRPPYDVREIKDIVAEAGDA